MHASGSLKIRPEKNEWRTGKDYTVQVVNPNAKEVKELVAATPSHNNYKSILIALVVICAVCGLIFLSIQLLKPPEQGPRVKGRKITLADIASERFRPQEFNGSWISDNEILFRDYLGGISIFNTDSLESKIFVANTTFRQLNAHKFAVSQDRRFLILIHDISRVWDHSSLAKYTLYDIENQFLSPLTPIEENRSGSNAGAAGNRISGRNHHVELQYVEWGPSGNTLIMIYQNDIYYKQSANSTTSVRITKTGKPEVIFNGVPDWLYEVEIFKKNKALWMSPDGRTLFYASFNDSQVGEVFYPTYGESSPYSQLRKWRYPKAGTTNPEVTLWVVKLDIYENNELHPVYLQLPDGIHSRDHYVSSLEWIDNEDVSIIWMNREENIAQYFTCSVKEMRCQRIYILRAKTGWLDFPQAPMYSSNKSSCLLRIPWLDGEAGYFHHIIWLDIKIGKEIPVTSGPFEVTQISAWDQFNQFIYFIGVPQGKPGERHLYRATEKSSNSSTVVTPLCLSCGYSYNEVTEESDEGHTESDTETEDVEINLHNTSPANSECLYNQVIFSETNQLFIKECLGPGFPTVTLHQAPTGTLIFVLSNNTALHHEVINLGLPLIKNFQVEVSNGFKANVRMFMPPGFRENEEFKFPLVLHIGGAPGTQLVSEKWRLSWASYLTSQKNFIVVEVDGRGTGYQGELIRHAVYQNLGVLEVADQLTVIKYLKENLDFIDVDNMGVWGWGYGGFLTLLTLAEDTEKLFRCAIAVSPITKWEFYDTVYAERYLGLPNLTANYHGYEQGDIVRVVKKLDNRKFLIIHGTADEKVHYQHSLHLSKALIKEGIPFIEQVYPDEGHEYSGVTEHLYNAIEDELESSFDEPDWEDWEKANFLGVTRS